MGFFENLFGVKDKSIAFEDYIHKGNAAYKTNLEFNICLTSVYGVQLIDRLMPDEPIYFEYSEEPYSNGELIRVMNRKHQQIGWAPFRQDDELSVFAQEFINQVKNRVRIDAFAFDHGVVDANPNYRWCSVRVILQVPYPENDEIVYRSNSGYLYHALSGCNHYAVTPIPKTLAEKLYLSPCKKCCRSASPDYHEDELCGK